MSDERMNGIVSALTPQRGKRDQKVSPLLPGLLPVEKRAIDYERALTSLDTGDPRGLEALDFGSVRGRPAVSFITPNGERRVMQVAMPTYLASLKARTEGRQMMRQKIEEDMKRRALQDEMAPKFQTALEQVSVSQGPLFAPLMASLFERDPEQAALLVNEVIKLERRKPQEAFALAQNAVKSETLLMAGAQQAKVRNFLKNQLATMRKNADESEKSGRPTRRSKSDLTAKHHQNITAAMDTLIGDRQENYGMSLRQRFDMDPQYAKMILEDLYTTLTFGTELPSGGYIKLDPTTAEGSSATTYLNTWRRALQEMGYTQPLTPEDEVLLLELALRKQGAEPNGEAAQMHINKHVESMNQAASNSEMPFGVDEITPEQQEEFNNYARENASRAGVSQEDAVRLAQTAAGRQRFIDLIESN